VESPVRSYSADSMASFNSRTDQLFFTACTS
jgi:hypothetical protein